MAKTSICPHCGHKNELYGGGVNTLTACGKCRNFLLPATEILKKSFAKATHGERLRVALEIGGIRDVSYETPSWGYTPSYDGAGTVTFADGRYKVIGHRPEGDPHFVSRRGRLEWVKG